jgi:hypothetical protein
LKIIAMQGRVELLIYYGTNMKELAKEIRETIEHIKIGS